MSHTKSKPVHLMSQQEKVQGAIERSYKHLDDHIVQMLKAMLTPEAIGIAVGVLAIWAASHFVGIGEIIDVILLVIGGIAVGFSVFQAAEHLYYFADLSLNARTETDLEKAGVHFSKAISILGVETVMTLLFRARPKTFKTKTIKVGKPPQNGAIRYKPSTQGNPKLKAGEGSTDVWGNVEYSTRGTARTQDLVRLHERVHQVLTPKLNFLRRIRVQMSINGYKKSYLLRYLEEALAETIAQVGVNGFRNVFEGVSFPVANGYVSIAQMAGEAAGMLLGPINVSGMAFRVYFRQSGGSN